MVRKLLRAALIASVAITVSTPATASNSWGGYHWARITNPVSLMVNKALTKPVWDTAVGAAVSDWNSSTGGSPGVTPPLLGSIPTGTSSILSLSQRIASGVSTKQCSPIAGQILVCNDSYGQRGWLGIASIWLSGLHITQGTTKLNDSYFNLKQYNTLEWRAMVACQEIGHDFGLDHQDTTFDNVNKGTCMDYTNAPGGAYIGSVNYGPSNVYPNQHDFDELVTIYTHLDTTTTAASFASTNFGVRLVGKAAPAPLSTQSSGDSPAEWGRAIRFDAQGRPDVYEKVLGPGQKVLTHVFWAIGEGPR